tara:strand:- start:569 stop:1267 length:699 start_codon:yes stop_codon:yes gene_type:complete
MDENTALGLDTSNPSESSEDNGPSFTVTVDGEQMDVSQSELINGYQRQADYTRKTQELATERERLAQGEAIVQALESDPESAVSALADAFGIRMGNQASVPQEEMEELDPEETRLRRIESAIEEQNRIQRQQNLQKEMNTLRDKYQADIDENALYSHALKHNIGNLDAAYTHMTYEDLQSKAKNSDIVEEKRAASIIEDGSGAAEGAISRDFNKAVNSLRDAFDLAKQELAQ